MDGPDQAVPRDALRRQLRRLRPPIASIAFRHQAWQQFERALDPLGEPRTLTEAKPSRHGKLANAPADPRRPERTRR